MCHYSQRAQSRVTPIQNNVDLCMLCSSGGECTYASWTKAALWLDIGRKLVSLAGASNAVWAVNEQRGILNLMWHYRKVDGERAPI